MRRRERELSVTIKSVQDLIFRTDARGVISFANERWMAIGGSAEQVLGRPLHELVLPEQRDALRALFSPDTPDKRSAVPPRAGHHRRPGRGAHAPLDVVSPLLRDGQIVGFAGSAADVTERVIAAEVADAAEGPALMLEISLLPLSMLDTQGRYLSVNQAWEEFTGRRRADVIGQAAASYPGAEEAALHDRHDRELLAGGGRINHEASVMHRDGTLRDVRPSRWRCRATTAGRRASSSC